MDGGAVPERAARCEDQRAIGGSGNIAAVCRIVGQSGPARADSSIRVEHPNLMGHVNVNLEPADDVELISYHGMAAGQTDEIGIARPVIGCRQIYHYIGNRVVSGHTSASVRTPTKRSTYTENVGRPTLREHTATHVVDMVVAKHGCLEGPSIGAWIIFSRVKQIVAGSVRAASAHGIKLPVGREEHPDGTDHGAWKVRTERPGVHRIWFVCGALRQSGHDLQKQDEQRERKRGPK